MTAFSILMSTVIFIQTSLILAAFDAGENEVGGALFVTTTLACIAFYFGVSK